MIETFLWFVSGWVLGTLVGRWWVEWRQRRAVDAAMREAIRSMERELRGYSWDSIVFDDLEGDDDAG